MAKIKFLSLVLISLVLTGCKVEKHKFPLDKRYWTIDDYDKAIFEIRYVYENDEKKPSFDDPKSRAIIQKLTDEQNFKIVLNDKELGLKYRNDLSMEFFNHWKDMNQIYQTLDRQDKYIYDKEMLAVWHFGLNLQLDYFKLGNDLIIESADDPSSFRVKSIINSNVSTLIDNYLIYLDEINNENAFSEEGKELIAQGIDRYFHDLISMYPSANFDDMKKKAELMLNKSSSDKINNSLSNLIELIDSERHQE
jgi:hypothetical protein